MDSPTRAIRHDELLQQMGWVPALARSLVRDPNVAEDVAQEAYLKAPDRPPHSAHSGAPLRAWLAAVTRTLARQSVRSETRRRGREHAAAHSEAETAARDVVERGEIQRDLVAAVLTPGEPYRSTVLLPYLDGLTGQEIAERMETEQVLVVPARRELRLMLPESSPAQAFELLDGASQPLPLADERKGRRLVRLRVPLAAGRSTVLVCSDEASSLRLLASDGEPLLLRPIQVLPGLVNEIR